MPTSVKNVNHYKYLIVGGGMTADAAVQGIRSIDSSSSIGLVSAESEPPYDRPPLSKALWKGQALESIWRKTTGHNIALHLGHKITKIDAESRQAWDARGNGYSWDKILLATGGIPRRLPFGDDEIIYYRTVADYQRLCASMESGRRYAVIGGGFIGSEVAAALAQNGREVTLIFLGSGIGDRVFPKELSDFLVRYYKEKGVRILAGSKVTGVERCGNRLLVKANSTEEVEVDGIVAGIGIEPDISLAKGASLKTGNGIVVDDYLCTSAPGVYAGGDVAEFYCPALQRRMRVEHEDNANTMGRIAGRNMAGASESYRHLPMFYSDIFDLGYEAVGELDARLETFADWKEPYREGVIYYLRDGSVRGVLLWNVWGQVDAARALVEEARLFKAGELKGQLK